MLEIEDRGRGIDWDRIAASARARGLPTATQADLQDAMFADGLSTRSEITELSGRGVGLAAFRAACAELGGAITVTSARDVGTKLSITWPAAIARRRSIGWPDEVDAWP